VLGFRERNGVASLLGREIVVGRGLRDVLCDVLAISMLWVALALAGKADHPPQTLGITYSTLEQ